MIKYIYNGYTDEQIPVHCIFQWLLTFYGPCRMEGTSIPEYNVDLKNVVDTHSRHRHAGQDKKPSYQVSLKIWNYKWWQKKTNKQPINNKIIILQRVNYTLNLHKSHYIRQMGSRCQWGQHLIIPLQLSNRYGE